MDNGLRELSFDHWPQLLHHIPDPPEQLYIRGAAPQDSQILLTVVGSRSYSPYGRDACEMLVEGLRGFAVSIVSGLALGIDGIAHEAALRSNLHCIAIPGSGLDDSVLYPASHKRLAWRILKSNGCLISEYEPLFRAKTWSFIRRNRIMAGIASAVLIIEATERSGTLVTARLAVDYNRDVLAVPGPITGNNSFGPNRLIQDGAVPILCAQDIIEVLHLEKREVQEENDLQNSFAFPFTLHGTEGAISLGNSLESSVNASHEKKILALLAKEPMQKDALIYALSLPSKEVNVMLTRMELQKRIRISNDFVSIIT